jgi:hypothetical protein
MGDRPDRRPAGSARHQDERAIALAQKRASKRPPDVHAMPRPVFIIAGSRDADNIYMRPALNWLIDDGVSDVIGAAEFGAASPLRPGRPTHYLPLLGMEDTVYVAGPQGLVDTIRLKAQAAAAQCYADPFLPSTQSTSMADRLRGFLFGRPRQEPFGAAAR